MARLGNRPPVNLSVLQTSAVQSLDPTLDITHLKPRRKSIFKTFISTMKK